jgi:hypothetical protein
LTSSRTGGWDEQGQQGFVLHDELLCHALAIIRYNYLFVEYVRRLSQCQVIMHPVEIAVVFGLLHSDGFEQESFPFQVHT